MRFYKSVTIDIATGAILSAVEFDWNGPVAEAKSSKSKTTVSIPPPTAEEREMQGFQRWLMMRSMEDQGMLVRSKADLDANPDSVGYGANGWREISPGMYGRDKGDADYTPAEREEREVEGLYRAEMLKRAKAGFGATQEEKDVIGGIYGTAQKRGQENIREFMSELSGSRGMDIADSSPMAREAARASQELGEGLEGSRSAAELDFGERSRIFNQELRGFQQGLKQTAMNNRLNTAGGYGSMAGNMANLRAAQTTTTSKQPSSGFLGALGPIMGGAGGMMSGLGAMGFSLRELKENITPTADLDALSLISNLDLLAWNYKADEGKKRHVGPMADDIHPLLKSADGQGLDLQNLLGVLLKANQQLVARVESLEHQDG